MEVPLVPLAERIRPKDFENFVGQSHLIGPNGPIKKAVTNGAVPSMILWGPPGVGKTTLAEIIANELDRPFYSLSAISSCLLYTSPSPRDRTRSRMPSSA